jgi:spore coat protein A, manganese oxidase
LRLSRKDFLKLGMAGATGLLLPSGISGCGLTAGNQSAQGSAGALLRSAVPLPEPFSVPLPIPPVLKPVRTDATADYYELTQRVGRTEILPGLKTEVWGYDGIFPGPTVESRSGRRTVVRHRNELPVPTVVHLHGGVTPPEHDGYPTDIVMPAGSRHAGHHRGHGELDVVGEGTFDYVYPLEQPAATLWYHDHRMDFTGPQVYRGLAGFHIHRDADEEELGLPTGERDVPLMICDRAFAEDGSFDYPSIDPTLMGEPGVQDEFMSGVLGDCILVNGAPWPYLEVTNTRYRFRILNASNARRYRLALDPPPQEGASFVQVGSDHGLLAGPVEHEEVEVAQAERFDVIVDFSGYRVGEEVTLVNELGSGPTARVMRFVVAWAGREESHIPPRLADFRPLSRSEAAVEREFVFARGGAQHNGMVLWTVNDEPFDPGRIDAHPELGSVELWRIRALNVEHPFHIHLAPFQVLTSGGGGDPGPYNAGWKDTVNLDNGGDVEVLIRFEGYRGRYVFHCHNLEHEDMMMMANFEVV